MGRVSNHNSEENTTIYILGRDDRFGEKSAMKIRTVPKWVFGRERQGRKKEKIEIKRNIKEGKREKKKKGRKAGKKETNDGEKLKIR